MQTPRLDVLLYAHDGRGLGHVSRMVGIGLALRRLFPRLRVLVLSGSALTGELVGNAPLDWLKLPGYRTGVVDGKAVGLDGYSGFSDSELAVLRAKAIADVVAAYRPRLVLADHSPQGKHKELLPSLALGTGLPKDEQPLWLLGIRGVVGDVPQTSSPLAVDVFARYFSGILWYGDPLVLGKEALRQLSTRYGTRALSCGYVSRLREYCLMAGRGVGQPGKKYCGVISIPWLGESAEVFLASLVEALSSLGPEIGEWRIFINAASGSKPVRAMAALANCKLLPPSAAYLEALAKARTALVFGGYNSLMDVLQTGIPATVILRRMRDREQQLHLERLAAADPDRFHVLDEEMADGPGLAAALRKQLAVPPLAESGIDLDGAAKAAKILAEKLGELRC